MNESEPEHSHTQKEAATVPGGGIAQFQNTGRDIYSARDDLKCEQMNHFALCFGDRQTAGRIEMKNGEDE